MTTEEQAYGIIVVIREVEDRFLILLQDKKFINWSFPKGKVEVGETPMQTAMRELREETGITDVKILDFLIIEDKYEYPRKGKTYPRVNTYFIGIVKDKSIKIQEDEILDYKWATYDEALKTFAFQKETRIGVLKKAKEYIDKI